MQKHPSLQKSLSYVVRGGVATSAMDTLAVGPTLMAYATFFGAGNLAFGILGAIPYLGNLIHLLAAWMIEKGWSVRRISYWASFLSRPFYLLAALLAFRPSMPGALTLLIFFLSATYLIGCIAGGAWLPWMKVLVPNALMGRFFSHRFKYMMLAKIICFLGASFFLQYIHNTYPDQEIYAYAVLLILAFIIGLYGAYTLLHVRDCSIPIQSDIPFFQKLRQTLKNKPFRHLLSSLSLLTFSQAFITPFITVFMLNRLNIQMSCILLLTLISQVMYMITVQTWGKMADRKGSVLILLLSIPLFIFVLLGLIWLNRASGLNDYSTYGSLFVLHALLGIATAGLTLGINNTSLLFVPDQMSAIYLSVNSTMKSLAGTLGSLSAGLTLSVCTTIEKGLSIPSPQAGWTSFCCCAVALCLLAEYLLIRLQRSISS